MHVLEPGCGSGKLGLWYAMQGANVTLMDIDENALEYAFYLHKLVQQARPAQWGEVTLWQGSIHDLGKLYAPDFDLVFNEGVVYFWRQPWRQHAINEMAKVTRPGGHVCVIGNSAHNTDIMKMAESVKHTYMGMPRIEIPFTRFELADRLRKAGLRDVQVRPVDGFMVDPPRWESSRMIAGWGTR